MQPRLFEEGKPKRKKPIALTGRSRKFLEHQGYVVALVERSVNAPRPNGEVFRNKFDAFNLADLCCVHPEHTGCLFVQVTDHHNRTAHINKMLAAPAAPVLLRAHNRIELHCWKSSKRKGQKLWCLRVQKLDDWLDGSLRFSEIEEHWMRDNMREIEPF